MQLAEIRKHPFLILALKDGEKEGTFSPDFIQKTKSMLVDMSLKVASKYFSVVYYDQIEKGCKVVLGIANLGLLDFSQGDMEKAKRLIADKGVVQCFRIGWTKVEKIITSGLHISNFSLGIDDISDVNEIYNSLLIEYEREIAYLELYKMIQSNENEYIHGQNVPEFSFPVLLKYLIGSDSKGLLSKDDVNKLLEYLRATSLEEVEKALNYNALITKTKKDLPEHLHIYLDEIIQIIYKDILCEMHGFVQNSQLFEAFNIINIIVDDVDSADIVCKFAENFSQEDLEYFGISKS